MRKMILLAILLRTLSTTAQPDLVGTFSYDGILEGGSIFRLNTSSVAGIIHSFDNFSTPRRPTGALAAGDGDWLYGMLSYNGSSNSGALYKINRDGTGFQLVHILDNPMGANTVPYYHTDGYIYFSNEFQFKKLNPATNAITNLDLNAGVNVKHLLIDSDDWIYFPTEVYTIAKIKTDGSQWTDLHNFNYATEGAFGPNGLTEIPGDTIFGVNTYGGLNDAGTIYSIKKDGTEFTVHHQFTTATGVYPESRLEYFDGKLYGTARQGGDFGFGVLYTINPDGTGYRVVHHFTAGTFGSADLAGNIKIMSNGRIFGTFAQFYSSSFSYYRCFKIDTSGQNFEAFFNVDQRELGHFNLGLLFIDEENFFLTTQEMGRHDGGVISRADTFGSASSLHQFGMSTNGFRPNTMIKASDGKLYGTALIGGTSGNGVIFSINTDGSGFTRLHQFDDTEGYLPSVQLLEASDGKLYGACEWGGATGGGCVYRIDKNGSNFEVIHYFTDLVSGYTPVGVLVEAPNGMIYGTTNYSSPGSGAIFRLNKDGTNYSAIKNFDNFNGIGYPSGLTLSSGYLYGSCNNGGAEFKGGIFRIRPDGSDYQVLHTFLGSTEGSNPAAAPIIASNGKLYGGTPFGGTNGHGIIYSLDSTGSNYTILRNLWETSDGGYIWSGLIQASDGLIYGITFSGDTAGRGGTIFKMNLDGSDYSNVHSFNSDAEGYGSYGLLDLNGSFVLPVEWMSFDAEKRGQAVLLTWKTAQEQNAERFDVERSSNGVTFSRIGTVAAVGNTNDVTSYTFTDHHPLNGSNYYRLKQVDFDDRFEYSKVVSVDMQGRNTIVLAPNPVKDLVELRFPNGNRYSVLSVVDASGRIVVQKQISNAGSYIQLQLGHLPPGWYILKVAGTEGSAHQTFLKQ